MGAIEVRTATSLDVGRIREIYRRASLSNADDRAVLLAHPEVLDFDDAPVHDGRTIVAVVDGAVTGFASVQPHGTMLELDDLFVDPDAMRRGVGRALMAEIVASARHAGFARIEVTDNTHALAFYTAVGFTLGRDVATRFGPASRLRLDLSRRGVADEA